MATLGFTLAVILLLVMDINLVLPYHVHHHYNEVDSSKVHGRVKTNKYGYFKFGI